MPTDATEQLNQINRDLQLMNRHMKLMVQMNRAFMKAIKLWWWENFFRTEKARNVATEMKSSIEDGNLFYYDCVEENSKHGRYRQLAGGFLLLLNQQKDLYNRRFSWHSR